MSPILEAILKLLESEVPAIKAFVLDELKKLDLSGFPVWEQMVIKLVMAALAA